MPRDLLYRIEVKEVPAQEIAVIAGRVPAAEFAGWLRTAFRELFDVAGQQGTGPPFAVTPDADAKGMVELEAALPVVASMAAGGRIERRADPAYRAIVALHQGPHDELPSVRSALENAMRMEGTAAAGPPRHVYLNDPEESADPRRHLTEVVLPIDVAAGWRPSDALYTEPLTP